MINSSVRRKLRRLYREAWHREWPEDDEFLSELWREAQGSGTPKRGVAAAQVYVDTLTSMRENHEFDVAARG